MRRHEFRAMGTTVKLFLAETATPGGEAALERGEAEFERLEALLSRFRPESELSRLNAVGRIEAGDELLEVVELALTARTRTEGRFDPTVHDALVAAGYDRTFEDVAPEGRSIAPRPQVGGAVTVDRPARTIELEPGVHLDLGGIGKGYAADRVASFLSAFGPCLVDAGGDIATRGRPAPHGWLVGVETGDETITLSLHGALATSGRDRRRWRRNGEERHHLIDPSTGLPATSDLLRVTALAETAAEAEVVAKTLFLAGEQAARREADSAGIPSVLVTADNRTLFAGGLR
jgi:thiamine biosynthesis lipoprotein